MRPAITFEVRLPVADWNGKSYMAGCGGFCGVLDSDRPGFSSNAMNVGLRRNYAVSTMDSGHWESASTDGRMAAIEAQRFPDGFDGIISGAPALDYTGLVATWFAWIVKACGNADGIVKDPNACARSVRIRRWPGSRVGMRRIRQTTPACRGSCVICCARRRGSLALRSAIGI